MSQNAGYIMYHFYPTDSIDESVNLVGSENTMSFTHGENDELSVYSGQGQEHYNVYLVGGRGDDLYSFGENFKGSSLIYEQPGNVADNGNDTLSIVDWDDLKAFSINGEHLVLYSKEAQQEITIIDGMNDDSGFENVILNDAVTGQQTSLSYDGFLNGISLIGDYSYTEAGVLFGISSPDKKPITASMADFIKEQADNTDYIEKTVQRMGSSWDEARKEILWNRDDPQHVYDTAQSLGLDVGKMFTLLNVPYTEDYIDNYFRSNGLDPDLLV